MKLFLTIAMVHLLCLGCDWGDHMTEPEPLPDLFPLAVGNYWVLLFEEYDNDTLNYTVRDSIYIDSMINWGGERYYRVNELFEDVLAISFVRNGDDGVYRLNVETGDSIDYLELKYPASVGDIWHVPWDREWDERDSIIVVSINDDISLDIGQFDGCYKYRYNNSSDEEGMWFQPGHGWVASRWIYRGFRQRMDLVAYRVE